MHLLTKRLLSTAMIALLACASTSTAQLRFTAPVVTGNSATAAPTPQPLKGLEVTVSFVSDVQTPGYIAQTLITNSNGEVPIPPGYTPAFTQLAGLIGQDVTTARTYGIGGYTSATLPFVLIDHTVYGTNVNLAMIPSLTTGGPITAGEASAYYHLQKAHDHLAPLVPISFFKKLDAWFDTRPVPNYAKYDLFDVVNTPQGTFTTLFDRVSIAAGSGPNPDAALCARSASTMAHEYGHRIIHYVYENNLSFPVGFMDEGLADFLSSVVTGSSQIGLGVGSSTMAFRDINSFAQYVPNPTAPKHTAGLVIGGAMYHCRELFQLNGKGALFDSYIAPILDSIPNNEVDVLCRLVQLDDDDNDLSNGTPNLGMIELAFCTWHGIPMPATVCGTTGPGTTTSIPAGWTAPGGTVPQLSATLSNNASQIDIQVTSTRPNEVGYLMISLAPPAPLQVAPGLTIFHDFANAVTPAFLPTDAAGSVTLSAPLTSPLPDFALTMSIVSPQAPYGYEISNGVLVQP